MVLTTPSWFSGEMEVDGGSVSAMGTSYEYVGSKVEMLVVYLTLAIRTPHAEGFAEVEVGSAVVTVCPEQMVIL